MLMHPIAMLAALLGALLAFSMPAKAAETGDRPVVTMINWEKWVSLQVVQSFEKKENVRVQVLTHDSVDQAFDLMANQAGEARARAYGALCGTGPGGGVFGLPMRSPQRSMSA